MGTLTERTTPGARRYDVDWLRVLAFSAVFFYHCGRFFDESDWHIKNSTHDLFIEQIGWPELVETVAEIYAALPPEDQAQTGILTGNYGEAGALNLYGPAYGLPTAISGVNSYWLRGYGDPPPQVLILLDWRRNSLFESCKVAGRVTNRYQVWNEEARHSAIYVCRGLRQPWPLFWESLRSYG